MFCTNCGNPVSDNAKFCPSCGAVLNQDSQPISAQQPQPAPQPQAEAPAPQPAPVPHPAPAPLQEPAPLAKEPAAPVQRPAETVLVVKEEPRGLFARLRRSLFGRRGK